MKIEHFALQVADPIAVARWYVVHLGMTIQKGSNQPPFAHFLADDGGQMLIELYFNDQFDVPDQSKVPPAHFHLAFVSEDIEKDRTRLIEAGAKEEGPIATQSNGDLVCFLRDPWGLTLQLVSRVDKLLAQRSFVSAIYFANNREHLPSFPLKVLPMRMLPTLLALLLLLPCPLLADELSFEPEELNTRLGVGYAVRLLDMNGDDKLDICIVDKERILWLENPSWTEHEILEPGQTNADNVAFAPADINGDGQLDFAVAAGWGGGKTQRGTIQWITSADAKGDLWNVYPIRNEHSTHRIRFANVIGDEKPELIIGPLFGPGTTGPHFAESGVRLIALEVPQNPTSDEWPVHMIDNSLHVMHNFLPIDFTGNGKTDIISASYEGVHLHELQDDGTWKKTQLGSGDQESSPSRGASEVKVGRLANGDRYIATIEPWHGNQIVVYTKPDDQPLRSLWTRHVLDDQLKWGHAVWCANLDDDADEELVIGVRDDQTDSTRRGLRIFDPQDAKGSQFKRTVIDPGAVAIEDLAVGDLNGDGKADIVAVGRQTNNAKIYWNRTQQQSPYFSNIACLPGGSYYFYRKISISLGEQRKDRYTEKDLPTAISYLPTS